MSILSIPVTSDPFNQTTVNLEGSDYLLSFQWNQRESSWYMSISLPDETLLASVKIVTNWALLRRFVDPRLPPGEMFAISTTNDLTNPGLNDFGPGLRVDLTYWDTMTLAGG